MLSSLGRLHLVSQVRCEAAWQAAQLQSCRFGILAYSSSVPCYLAHNFAQAILNPSDDALFNIVSSVCNVEELDIMDVRGAVGGSEND